MYPEIIDPLANLTSVIFSLIIVAFLIKNKALVMFFGFSLIVLWSVSYMELSKHYTDPFYFFRDFSFVTLLNVIFLIILSAIEKRIRPKDN